MWVGVCEYIYIYMYVNMHIYVCVCARARVCVCVHIILHGCAATAQVSTEANVETAIVYFRFAHSISDACVLFAGINGGQCGDGHRLPRVRSPRGGWLRLPIPPPVSYL